LITIDNAHVGSQSCRVSPIYFLSLMIIANIFSLFCS